jgi:proline iminopeptidase
MDYYHESVNAHADSHPLLFMNSLIRGFRMKPEVVMVERLSEVKQSTLVVMGEHDNVVPLSTITDTIQQLPNARLVVIPGVGHAPNQEDPDRFNRLVLNFLTEERAS